MNDQTTSDARQESLAAAQAELIEDFSLFDDWTDRYRYLIDLGRKLPPFPAQWQTEENRLHGCQSQVWLHSEQQGDRLRFYATSDSAIVRGLIAILLMLYDNRTPQEILDTEPEFIAGIGLDKHLSMTRSNGLASMLKAIRQAAAQASLANSKEPLQDDLLDLYGEQVQQLAANIPRQGRLDDPDITIHEVSRVCGSSITVDLKMAGTRVANYAQEVKACALGRASAALFGGMVVGREAADIRQAREQMWAMLRQEGPVPTGDWAPFGIFLHARPFKSRHGSIMLCFDATTRGFDQLGVATGQPHEARNEAARP